MDPANFMIEEYKTLRQEVLASMANRNSALQLGTAAMAASLVIFGWQWQASGCEDAKTDIAAVFAMVVTLVAATTLLVWLGELERSYRAGTFLIGLEARINKAIGANALTWEGQLSHSRWKYHAAVAMMLGLAAILAGAAFRVAGVTLASRCPRLAVAVIITTGVYSIWRIEQMTRDLSQAQRDRLRS